MKAIDTIDWIYRLCCLGLGAIFIYAGSLKIAEPQIFATLIEAYGIVPERLVEPVAMVIPAMEIVAGLGLILNIKGSLSVIALLLVLFVALLAYGIWMGLDVDCGCFGPQDPEAKAFNGLWLTLYRDLTMLAGTVFVFGWRRFRDIQPIQLMLLIKNRLNSERGDNLHV